MIRGPALLYQECRPEGMHMDMRDLQPSIACVCLTPDQPLSDVWLESRMSGVPRPSQSHRDASGPIKINGTHTRRKISSPETRPERNKKAITVFGDVYYFCTLLTYCKLVDTQIVMIERERAQEGPSDAPTAKHNRELGRPSVVLAPTRSALARLLRRAVRQHHGPSTSSQPGA